MTARTVARRAGATRLLGWALLAAVCGFLMWIVFGGVTYAEDTRAAEPKAAARAIGNAGNAAARTIARDSSNAAEVPGYAGTNLPERSLTASGMEDAARVRLADPDDPGGKAGRAVIRGTTQRPQRPVAAGDPAVLRSERIAASPQSSAHGADNLASGQHRGLRGGPPGRRGRRVLRAGHILRRRRLRNRAAAGQHRLRRGRDPAQHGAGARRRRVRPEQPALLHRAAARLLAITQTRAYSLIWGRVILVAT